MAETGCNDAESQLTTEKGFCLLCASADPGPTRAHIVWGAGHFTCIRRVDAMKPEAIFAARALLINSLTDVDFMYHALTKTEKELCTKTQFTELVKWIHGRG